MMEWISSEERLPEECGRYLVFRLEGPHAHTLAAYSYPYPCCEPNIAYYSSHDKHWKWSSFEIILPIVTHWMPLPKPPEVMMECEFGTNCNIRWLKPEDGKMYDSDGNVILCKCGKPAGSGAWGKGAFFAWCSDCNPRNNYSAGFVYRPPEV